VPLKIRRLPLAEDDLLDIWASIALHSPRAADRLVARFYEAEDKLAENPLIGEARPELGEGLRKWTVGAYLMFYAVEPDALTIVRVLDGRRDLARVFDPWP
jgi:toxin ParE1/3/4